MAKIKFEYKITLAYLFIGSIWIIFSDKLLNSIIEDNNHLTEAQTYKGWFYVWTTAILLFFLLKKHLKKQRNTEKELERHKTNLEQLVLEKTKKLNTAITELSATNKELHSKSKTIDKQNIKLRKALKDLMSTQAQLLQADKMASLGVLTAGVAHEINNPLNYILGGITGLETYFEEQKVNTKKTLFFFQSIKTGIDRISSIISGLNQFSSDTDTYEQVCDIHEIINNCLTIINSQLANKIQVMKEFSNIKLIISGNIGQIHQVFVNVLMNAIQAIEKEGSIRIVTNTDNENVYI
jgi:C4-dicarboxylate-specific signal transduction histidine kinase